MKRAGKLLICLLVGFSSIRGAHGVVNDANKGSYDAIAKRNAFDLHEVPPPPSCREQPGLPPIQIRLTGITTIFGDKRALLMVQEPAVAGKPAGKEESYILSEGQRQGAIQVLAIDEKTGTVRLSSDDTVSVLTFPIPKLPNAPAPAALPATVRVPPAAPAPLPGRAGGF
jgi:hypothetical protein